MGCGVGRWDARWNVLSILQRDAGWCLITESGRSTKDTEIDQHQKNPDGDTLSVDENHVEGTLDYWAQHVEVTAVDTAQ